MKFNEDGTIGDLKKLVAAQTGTKADKIRIHKWYATSHPQTRALLQLISCYFF
ncbi:hypothetical protein DITRI_Ditri14bG0083000 [Diplodiscus trichospermus]